MVWLGLEVGTLSSAGPVGGFLKVVALLGAAASEGCPRTRCLQALGERVLWPGLLNLPWLERANQWVPRGELGRCGSCFALSGVVAGEGTRTLWGKSGSLGQKLLSHRGS